MIGMLPRYPEMPEDRAAWFELVHERLTNAANEWSRLDMSGANGDRELSWALLGWVEVAASRINAGASQDLLLPCLVALGVLSRSNLDRRDILIVASLLRVAMSSTGVELESLRPAVAATLGESGAWGMALLESASVRLPETHALVGTQFKRVSSDFDEQRLLQKFSDNRPENSES